MARTVVGLFDKREEARSTEHDLIQAGFRPDDIRVFDQPGETMEHQHDEGFWDKMRNFFGLEDADTYEQVTRTGGTLLTITTPDDSVERAVDIIQRHDPIDIDRRMAEMRPEETTTTEPARATTQTAEGEQIVPVVEEQLKIGKRERRGGVRIYQRVEEKPVEEDVRLRDERVTVERRKTDRPAKTGDIGQKTVEVTETHEEPVIAKEARVVEEVVVGKKSTERTETVRDTVRRTDVEVERLDTEFRRDFEQTYGTSGGTYDQYQPAYTYGHQLAETPDLRDKDWNAIEPSARQSWEQQNPGSWDRFKNAIRTGFDRARSLR